VVAGFDSHEEICRSDDLLFSSGNPSADVSSGGRQRTVGVFGEDLIQIVPRWLVAVTARFNSWCIFDASTLCSTTNPPCPQASEVYEDGSDNAFNPQLSLVHQINSDVSWSASIHRAFCAATRNEL
jgi:outer membrane receptor protein involved in Fe transport